MRLPLLDEQDRSTVNVETVKGMVDRFLERGFTYFDTAHRYHDEASEPAVRRALTERYPRDRYVLTNKITLNYIRRPEDQEPFLRRQLERAAEVIRSKAEIACTNCRYCTTECPRQIAIPDYFGLYNNMKRLKNTGYTANQRVYYANLARTHGKASDCIHCGLCEKNCPQRLPIRDLLETVSQELEQEDVRFPAPKDQSCARPAVSKDRRK